MKTKEPTAGQPTAREDGKPIILFIGSSTLNYWKQDLIEQNGPYQIEHFGIDAGISFAQICKETSSGEIVAVVACMDTSTFNQKTRIVTREESQGGKTMGIAVGKCIRRFFPKAHLFLFTNSDGRVPELIPDRVTLVEKSKHLPSQFSPLVLETLQRR